MVRQCWAGPRLPKFHIEAHSIRQSVQPQWVHYPGSTSRVHLRNLQPMASNEHHWGLRVLPPPHTLNNSSRITRVMQEKSISQRTEQDLTAHAMSQSFFFFYIRSLLYSKLLLLHWEKHPWWCVDSFAARLDLGIFDQEHSKAPGVCILLHKREEDECVVCNSCASHRKPAPSFPDDVVSRNGSISTSVFGDYVVNSSVFWGVKRGSADIYCSRNWGLLLSCDHV